MLLHNTGIHITAANTLKFESVSAFVEYITDKDPDDIFVSQLYNHNLCWAACAVMIYRGLGDESTSQDAIARKVLGNPVYQECASQCGITPSDSYNKPLCTSCTTMVFQNILKIDCDDTSSNQYPSISGFFSSGLYHFAYATVSYGSENHAVVIYKYEDDYWLLDPGYTVTNSSHKAYITGVYHNNYPIKVRLLVKDGRTSLVS
jgi:hypothetical protein